MSGLDVGGAFPIAVDGPASSGKSSLGRRLADDLGLPFLDTGLLYRAIGRDVPAALLDEPSAAEEAAVVAAHRLDLERLDDPELGTQDAGERASKVAVIPAVREALLDLQRRFAARPGGAVLVGRDIGSRILPAAPVKIFITASVEVRAERRVRQLRAQSPGVIHKDVLAELRRRDERDATRSAAPLLVPTDAFVLDTTTMGFESALAVARSYIDERAAQARS